jgi:hypothetical protein
VTASPVALKGIYVQIRHLKQVGLDHYEAYAADGRFLVDVDTVGARQVLDSDSYRVTVTPLSPSRPRWVPPK